MYITKNDIRMFYELLNHYSIGSPNIGVISKPEFNKVKYRVKKYYKGMKVNIQENDNMIRVITDDDIETTYIKIDNTDDLQGRHFKKFI